MCIRDRAEEYIIDPDWEMFQRLWERSGHNIRLVDVAPEPVSYTHLSSPPYYSIVIVEMQQKCL